MSGNSSEDASELIKVKSELRQLQESFNPLNEKYLKLVAHDSRSVENSEEIENELDDEMLSLDVKMLSLDVDQSFIDPIKFLPESCAVEILKNLTGKELLTAMEVSKFWRDFIKVKSVLMDKIVFKPTIDNDKSCDFLINAISDERNLRRYKHYKGPLYIYTELEKVLQGHGVKKVCPVDFFASSLETADILDLSQLRCRVIPNDPFMAIRQNFSQLQKLTFPVDTFKESLSIIKAAKFPMLTYLKLTEYPSQNRVYVGDFEKFDLENFICSLPKLQALFLRFGYEIFCNHNRTVQHFPKIRELYYFEYCPGLMKELHSSLERYEVEDIKSADLSYILRNFKRLKSLTIPSFTCEEDDIKFETNKSIEAFYIGFTYPRSTISNVTRFLKDILVALPSIKKLILGELSVDIIKFIANNMLNLKQLGYCYGINIEWRNAYEEIRSNPENFINTDFEFLAWRRLDKMEL